MKQTYEQRVSEIVEKMKFYSTLEQMARIAVAEMAEAYEAGRAKGYDLGVAWEQRKRITISPKFELIEQGLIPDQETPKESAFEKAIREAVERNNGREDGKDAPKVYVTPLADPSTCKHPCRERGVCEECGDGADVEYE